MELNSTNKNFMNLDIDISILGGGSSLSKKQPHQIYSAFENSHQMATICEQDLAATRRVPSHTVLRILIAPQENSKMLSSLRSSFPARQYFLSQ
jgi:hypothetical protein